jgi:hypothetical protein
MPLSVDIFNKKILSDQSRFGKYNILLSGEVAEIQLPTTIVYTTGNQTISGIKNFNIRPTVNGTGILLSGEAASLPSTIVYTTGNQIISGNKTFANDITVQGAILVNQVIDITTTGTISGVTGEFQYLKTEGGMFSGDNFEFYAYDYTFSGANVFFLDNTGYFSNRPLVNGTGVLLSGEVQNFGVNTTDSIVYAIALG